MQVAKRAMSLQKMESKTFVKPTINRFSQAHSSNEYESSRLMISHGIKRFQKSILLTSVLASQAFLMNASYALTVEPIHVKSALGEPFRAELVISDIAGVNPSTIQVGLANDAEFLQLGINKKKASNSLHFNTQFTSPERGVITITSDQALNDPYIEFVVHIGFGNNVRLQQVTALVDPPLTRVQTDGMNLPVQKIELAETQPTPTPVADVPVDTPPAQPAPAPAPAPAPENTSLPANAPLTPSSATPPAMDGDTTPQSNDSAGAPVTDTTKPVTPDAAPASSPDAYTVKRNDSLWAIATRMQKDLNRPIPVIMRSIQQLNKSAFIGGNPNQIKNGATLALPTQQTVEQEAVAPVNQAIRIENEDTESNKAPTLRPQNVPPTSSKSKFVRRGHLPDAKMTLVAPTQQGDTQGGATSGNSQAAQKQLNAINAKISVSRQQNFTLGQEITDLESQIKANEQKLALQNAKLAELMQRLKNRKDAAPQQRN